MSVLDFQRALCDMTLDPSLAVSVRLGGASALSGYALTGREQQRLVATARQPGMSVTCSLARANRFAPIADAFPLTCSILKPVLRPLLDDLWRVQRPDNYQLSGEVGAFAEHIQRKLAQGSLDHPYIDEIFRYERAVWTLIQPLLKGGDAPEQTLTVHFAHDPEVLLPLLQRDEVPADLGSADYAVRIRIRDGALETVVL